MHPKRMLGAMAAVALLTLVTGYLTGQGTRGSTLGDPLPGITASERVLFAVGRDDVLEVEEIDEGLGPVFNARSCISRPTRMCRPGGSLLAQAVRPRERELRKSIDSATHLIYRAMFTDPPPPPSSPASG